LQRIIDLPKGGGVNGGDDVWFEIATDDGGSTSYYIDRRLMQPFVTGLDLFASQAERAKDPNAPRTVPAVPAEAVRFSRTGEGGVVLSIDTGPTKTLHFVLPPTGIKPMLAGLLKGLAG
jgi:hypothetical protein